MQKNMMLKSPVLALVLAGYAALSTSALVAQIIEDQAPTQPSEESVPADDSAAEASESVEESPSSESEEGTLHRVEKPQRIRQEQRDQLQEQSRQQEEVGRIIEQQIERALDSGEDIPDFEVMKERAKEQLFEASESHAEMQGEAMGEEHRVCFRSDGSVTDNRQECDPDQSSHFGIQETEPGDSDAFGYAPASDANMQEHMEERFGQSEFQSTDLTGVVSEALERLSAMMSHMQGNPAAMTQIQETITYLSAVLRQQSTGQTPAEDTREQIRMRLERIMQTVQSSGGGADGHMGQGFGSPDMSKVLAMMEKMIPKLPQVIAIFEEEGIAVDPDARAAANEAVEALGRLKGPCSEGQMESCMELGEVMSTIDQRMRPPMEAAMEAAGKYEVGMRIQELMSEGMEDMDMDNMGPPPGMNGGSSHQGPPSGYEFRGQPPGMNGDYHQGPPNGFDPSQFRGQPPGMQGYGQPPHGYGAPQQYPQYPQGDHQSPPPEGFDPSMMYREMPQGDSRPPEGYPSPVYEGYPEGMPQSEAQDSDRE
ncbi:MAG: hypothetical protein Greene101449_418 [Candidatus Peregrinibacteria bacterium Greene1014_49]|nr:MAG: hypothetical protein Greene101449_418 [Candidatus Peregrinibacteria bacterium Greene1014_49]